MHEAIPAARVQAPKTYCRGQVMCARRAMQVDRVDRDASRREDGTWKERRRCGDFDIEATALKAQGEMEDVLGDTPVHWLHELQHPLPTIRRDHSVGRSILRPWIGWRRPQA